MTEASPAETRVKSVMEDPGSGAIARVYAQAYLGAIPPAEVDEAHAEFRTLVEDVLPRFPQFVRRLASAVVSRDEKLALVERVVAGRASERFTSFLRVLARHDRLELLPQILRQFGQNIELRSGRRRVQVTSARPLTEAELKTIHDRLDAVLPYTPVVEPATDPHLLGGLKIRVGDTVYDGSLRARLTQLRSQVRERSLNEIQSGRNRFSHPEGN
jgi:F-type H+-transporting ATPase subunit delta